MNAQDYCNEINKVDSLGRKQGIWIEYEIIPRSFELEGEYDRIVSPLDSTKKYLLKRQDFSKIIKLIWLGRYLEGLKSGEWVLFNLNGEVSKRVNYIKGRLYGNYTEYWINGQVMLECVIDNSNFISGVGYNRDGVIVIENDSINKVDFIESFYNPAR